MELNMQRKLVSFDVFEKIEKNSLTNAVSEINESLDILGDALNLNLEGIYCYDGSSVILECADGTFLKASYELKGKDLNFTNIESLVIDEETETNGRKAKIREMVSALENQDEDKAKAAWEDVKVMLERVMKRGRAKKSMVAMADDNFKKMGKMCEAYIEVGHGAKDPKKALAAKRGWAKRRPMDKLIRAKTRSHLTALRAKRKASSLGQKAKNLRKSGVRARAYFTRKTGMNEWVSLLENFYTYTNGFANNASVTRNENGDVAAVRIPTKSVRNEGKVIQIKLDTLKADVKILRESAHKLIGDVEFSKAMSYLKRQNNISDNEALEETVAAVVSRWPEVIGLTQEELASVIAESLKLVGETNWDDNTTLFMAEGILRTGFEAFPEKVSTILRLSDTNETGMEDKYEDFQARVNEFYSKLDESIKEDISFASEIFNMLAEVNHLAATDGDLEVKSDTSLLLNEIKPMVEGIASVDMAVVEVAADYLSDLIEESVLDSKNDWSHVASPEVTVNGDGSGPMKNSKFMFNPSELDSYGRPAQIDVDSMDLKSTSGFKKGPGNSNGPDTWDSLHNPYLLKNLRPWVSDNNKGETCADSDEAMGQNDGKGETWDNDSGVKNPYLPASMKPARPDMGEKDVWFK